MSKAKTRVEAVEEALRSDTPVPAAADTSVSLDGELFATQESVVAPAIDPDSPERFVNRELSWLTFNGRVYTASISGYYSAKAGKAGVFSGTNKVTLPK